VGGGRVGSGFIQEVCKNATWVVWPRFGEVRVNSTDPAAEGLVRDSGEGADEQGQRPKDSKIPRKVDQDSGAGAPLRAALLHGSEVRTDSPSPERESRHSVAGRHPKQGHRVEDLTRELYLDALAVEGSTSHTSTDDCLVTEDGILHEAPGAVA
jgi:hypothetical protein